MNEMVRVDVTSEGFIAPSLNNHSHIKFDTTKRFVKCTELVTDHDGITYMTAIFDNSETMDESYILYNLGTEFMAISLRYVYNGKFHIIHPIGNSHILVVKCDINYDYCVGNPKKIKFNNLFSKNIWDF